MIKPTEEAQCINECISVGIVIFISIYGQWQGVEINEKLIIDNILRN